MRLSEAQNHRCAYCGVEMTLDQSRLTSLTEDHVVAQSVGGSDRWENRVAACAECNIKKDSKDAYLFLEEIRQEKVEYRAGIERAKKDRSFAFEFAETVLRLPRFRIPGPK